MNILSKEWKCRLNVLIPYYRKLYLEETKDDQWKQRNFYFDEEKKVLVCSTATYSRLENNKSLVSDHIYMLAIKKLGKTFLTSNRIELYLQKIVLQLYTYLDCDDEPSALLLINNEYSFISHIKDTIYYEEYKWFFDVVIDYISGNGVLLSAVNFHKAGNIIATLPKQMQWILMHYLYVYAKIQNTCLLSDILDMYDYKNSPYFENKLIYINKLNREERNIEAFDTLREMITITEKHGNMNQLAHIYCNALPVLTSIDKKMAYVFLEKGVNLAKNHKLSFRINFLMLIYHANLLLILEKYQESKQHFIDCIHVSKILLTRNYVCLCFCHHMLGEEIPVKYLQLKELSNDDFMDELMYLFYKDYATRTAQENIRYLMNKLVPIVTQFDTMYLRMVDYELLDLCEETNHYKTYIMFMINVNSQK